MITSADNCDRFLLRNGKSITLSGDLPVVVAVLAVIIQWQYLSQIASSIKCSLHNSEVVEPAQQSVQVCPLVATRQPFVRYERD